LGFVALAETYLTIVLDNRELAEDLSNTAREQVPVLSKVLASKAGVGEARGKRGILIVAFACLKYQTYGGELSSIAVAGNVARIEGPCAR
jgi:hypothetical protein